jgi:hypothetical protein
MSASTLEEPARVRAERRGPDLTNRLLRAQRSAAGAAAVGLRLIYLEGRTIFFVRTGPQPEDQAHLASLTRRLQLELGFEPMLLELASA